MGIRVGLLGAPNTGKSFGRSYLNGEDCFAILPSTKEPYLYKKGTYPDNPKLVDKLVFFTEKNPTTESVAGHASIGWNAQSKDTPEVAIMKRILKKPSLADTIKFSGNYYVASTMLDIPVVAEFIEKFTPIRVIIIADFTHFLTNIMGTESFQNSSGYGKFVKVAIQTLNIFFTESIDKMDEDMIVITEYHLEEREGKATGIFVPSGKMLKDHFKPESYFDILLGSQWISPEVDPTLKKNERYVYLTERTVDFEYVRDLGMFEESKIPNNLQLVIDKIRQRRSND
jgi:hypothetical protein